jgi:DNA polymerase-3 subunit beta
MLTAVAVDGFRIALRKHAIVYADAGGDRDGRGDVINGAANDGMSGITVVKSVDNTAFEGSEPDGNCLKNKIYVIIPGKTVNELIKIIPSVPGNLYIYGTKKQIIIEFDNCRVYSGIIDGEFFNYRYIVPEQTSTDIIIDKLIMLEAVERASLILSAETVKRFPVLLSIKGDVLKILSTSNLGLVDEKINIDTTGKDVEVAFNPKFLIDALKAIEDEKIRMSFTSEVGQCLIRPLNNDGFVHLILPVKRRA